jgi:mono/diheme cytochrome c family protein
VSTNEIIMAIVCAVLVVFSLTVALVVPKRNPSFPRRFAPFFAVAILLVIGMLATIEFLGAEPEESEAAAPVTGPAGGTKPGDPVAGKAVFIGPAGCGSCHTLADAGTTGTVGPNLDDAKPPYDLVIDRVTHGKAPMPAFGDQGILTEKQIQDVAAYVVKATSGS